MMDERDWDAWRTSIGKEVGSLQCRMKALERRVGVIEGRDEEPCKHVWVMEEPTPAREAVHALRAWREIEGTWKGTRFRVACRHCRAVKYGEINLGGA